VNPLLTLVLAAAVGASFSSRIEVVAAAAVVACAVAWIADRDSFRRVLRVGLVLGAVFAAAAATAAVAWASGFDRGLMIGGTVLLRLVVLGTAAAVLTRSVDAETIMTMTSRYGMERLGLVFGLALNALPHLSETASTVWDAHRIRSGGRWAALRRFPALAEVLLAHTSRVADQAAAAAALRGHTALSRTVVPLVTGARTMVITGPTGSGKTLLVSSVVDELGRRGIPVAGFFQPAIVENRKKIGFRVQDAATGEVLDLARRVARGDGDFGTSFEFFDAGFYLGRRALADLASGSVLVIDELGPIELRGGGHWPAVERALTTTDLAGLVVVVRRTLVPALVEALDAGDVVVVDLEVEGIDPLSVVIDALVADS
jgi:nucleoside-triphosphatase THEP1/energy-coupling factor transporter transmembrane protein EcfT